MDRIGLAKAKYLGATHCETAQQKEYLAPVDLRHQPEAGRCGKPGGKV